MAQLGRKTIGNKSTGDRANLGQDIPSRMPFTVPEELRCELCLQLTLHNGTFLVRSLSCLCINSWVVLVRKRSGYTTLIPMGYPGQSMDGLWKTIWKKIAKFLVEEGITAIKFCPFDKAAVRNNGEYISRNDIDKSLDWIKRVRDSVGFDLEMGCEFHSYWNLPSATRIAHALEPYDILFLEDMLLQDNIQAYVSLEQESSIPLVISERLATRFDFREMFEAKAGSIAMYDLTWCGGISEGKKISDMANTYYIPTMMHTSGGPILWYASTHLAAAVTNLFYVESVYPEWHDRNPRFFDNAPRVNKGMVQPPDLPGLGLQFKEGLFEQEDVIVETISEKK